VRPFKVTKAIIIFFTDDNLEATLAKCDGFLNAFDLPSTSKNWENRMSNLPSRWDSSRKLLFEAVLSYEGLPSPDCCQMCLEGAVLVRCTECAVSFMCPSCDEKVHQFLPFHNRDGYLNGYFQSIPPTVTLDENGTMQTTCKYTIP